MEDAALVCPENGPGLVVTVDFITPIVDEPEAYGAIAAANSLSDVYAMGGEPMVALAVCGFPDDRLSKDVLARIFRGGRDKAAEAGCAIVGGHTVVDSELKYGLAVIGTVDPERALLQTRARAGDKLVLTKPIGTGIAAQAIKSGTLAAEDLAQVIGQPLFERWCGLVGEPAFRSDPRFGSDASRGENGAVLSERMARWCAERTTRDALAELDAANIPAGPVYSPQAAVDDPHVSQARILRDVDFPGLPVPAPISDTPVRFSESSAGIRARAPLLGEHTDAVLAELGYSEAEVAELRAQRAI